MKKYVLRLSCLLLGLIVSNLSFGQTLDQQLRQAAEAKVLSATQAQALNPKAMEGLGGQNQQRFFDGAPEGITSLLTVPDLIEEVQSGYLTMYFPKGYGRNNLHYGIWNAIPFVVFDNNTLELRFGLIFEHRQVGFVPDDWISTSITSAGMPEIGFLVPNSKTFLNFAYGTSQWRATVLLTDAQIAELERYTLTSQGGDPEADIITINHRFIDSSTRSYLIGLRHKGFFKMMIQLYKYIGKSEQVKKFRGSDTFPAGAFFDELTIDTITEEETIVQTSEVEETIDGGYTYEEGYEYDITEGTVTENVDGGYGYEEYTEAAPEGEEAESGYTEEGEEGGEYAEDEVVAEVAAEEE